MPELLFVDHNLFSVIQNQEKAVKEEIDNITSEALAHTTADAEVVRLLGKYRITVPVLKEEAIEIKQQEAQVEVSRRVDMRFGGSGPHYRPAVQYSFFVPFTGEPELFRCRPSQYDLSPPQAEIGRGELIINFAGPTSDVDPAKAHLSSTLTGIKVHLQRIEADLSKFNSNLEGLIHNALAQRQAVLAEQAKQLNKSGFKVRK